MAEILVRLESAIREYDAEVTKSLVSQALEAGLDPTKVLETLTTAIREVGDGFERGELWLPDLVGAADAMQAAMPLLEERFQEGGLSQDSLGTVVIGTVFGDIHNIGKAMVGTLLVAGGFKVHDLGVNVKAKEFVDAVKRCDANIIAMSTLLTTTASEMRQVITALEDQKIRDKVKVMVGGGAITADFAQSIGADGYDPTAPGAVAVAKKLLQRF